MPATAEWNGPHQNTDQMTDVKRVSIDTISTNKWSGSITSGTATLLIRCQKTETDLWIDADSVLESDYMNGSVKIVYRLDDQKAVSSSWIAGTDHKSAFTRNPVPLIRDMLKAKRMRIQVPWFVPSGSTWVADFDIEGLGDKIGDIAKACNWKLQGPNVREAQAQAAKAAMAKCLKQYNGNQALCDLLHHH
ncbi:MAG TPA: hypothetical protein VFC51_12180 [Chloroflexota bacterium]|nr:hypothetical protein [Chloroflexota bacterium]